MTELRRREYRNPNIVGAVAQVLLDWTSDQFKTVCDLVQSRPCAEFQSVEPQTTLKLEGAFGPGQPQPTQVIQQEFGGLLIKHVDGHELVVEQNGFRVVLRGAYPGRKMLFRLVQWVTDYVAEVAPSVQASRVSILFACNINAGLERYQIEDYIVPRFELGEENLSMFLEFQHQVAVDLSVIANAPIHGVLRIGTDYERGGISLTIDVLDHRATTLEDIASRLQLVKDLESHVFECTITDRTRQLYGVN